MKHVLVVGATDGIGLALCNNYLASGWRVALVGQDAAKTERVGTELRTKFPDSLIIYTVCDVRDAGLSRETFDRVVRELGQLDLLIFCAGVFHIARGYDLDLSNELDTFVVNLLGAVTFVALSTNYFVNVGKGHIAVIGSVAGERGRKSNPSYCAAKAGLHTYLEGLRARLHPLGIKVTTIKPGFVDTKMLGGGRGGRKDVFGVISAEKAARIIKGGIDRGRDSFFVPSWWFLVSLALRLTPRSLFKRYCPA